MKSISIYRVNGALLLVILSSIVLYYGKVFLIPLFFSIMFSMLLLPVCRKLEEWGVGRIGSTLLGILLILFFVAAIMGIIGAQAASLSEDLPKMQAKMQQMIQRLQAWIEGQFGVAPQEQIAYLQKGVRNVSQSANSFFTSLLSGTMGFLTGFVLFLLYFFFFMWKREKYKEFVLRLVEEENRIEVSREIGQIVQVASQYLVGRLISMMFLAVFYMIGFSIVGLPNGLLVALVAVLPTIVPYVGAFVGGFFPLALALMGGSSGMVLPVLVILVVAQTIDNNIIEPLVEGESLNISPIFTIIGIVLGELVWGIAGMILFIPMFAILKIICDHVPALNAYAFLLKNEVDEPEWVQKIRKKVRQWKEK